MLEHGQLPENKIAFLSAVDQAVHRVGVLNDQGLNHVAALFFLLFEHVPRVVQGVGVPVVVLSGEETASWQGCLGQDC